MQSTYSNNTISLLSLNILNFPGGIIPGIGKQYEIPPFQKTD